MAQQHFQWPGQIQENDDRYRGSMNQFLPGLITSVSLSKPGCGNDNAGEAPRLANITQATAVAAVVATTCVEQAPKAETAPSSVIDVTSDSDDTNGDETRCPCDLPSFGPTNQPINPPAGSHKANDSHGAASPAAIPTNPPNQQQAAQGRPAASSCEAAKETPPSSDKSSDAAQSNCHIPSRESQERPPKRQCVAPGPAPVAVQPSAPATSDAHEAGCTATTAAPNGVADKKTIHTAGVTVAMSLGAERAETGAATGAAAKPATDNGSSEANHGGSNDSAVHLMPSDDDDCSDEDEDDDDEVTVVAHHQYPTGYKATTPLPDADDVILIAHYQPLQTVLDGPSLMEEAPEDFDCTVKVDGSYRNGFSTCAACIFETGTDDVSLFPCNLGVTPRDSGVAELEAIVLGITKAIRMGFRRPRIRSDCVGAIQCVTSNGKLCTNNRADLEDKGRIAYALLNSPHFEFWRIEHISRQSNTLADSVAAWAHERNPTSTLPRLSPTAIATQRYFCDPCPEAPSGALALAPVDKLPSANRLLTTQLHQGGAQKAPPPAAPDNKPHTQPTGSLQCRAPAVAPAVSQRAVPEEPSVAPPLHCKPMKTRGKAAKAEGVRIPKPQFPKGKKGKKANKLRHEQKNAWKAAAKQSQGGPSSFATALASMPPAPRSGPLHASSSAPPGGSFGGGGGGMFGGPHASGSAPPGVVFGGGRLGAFTMGLHGSSFNGRGSGALGSTPPSGGLYGMGPAFQTGSVQAVPPKHPGQY